MGAACSRNIKNAIQFLLSGNMAGILCVLYCLGDAACQCRFCLCTCCLSTC